MTAPSANMAGWAVADYELAYDGLVALEYAGLALVNQPRASGADSGELRPGATFISSVVDDVQHRLQEIETRLEHLRFADPLADDRRIRLLIIHRARALDTRVAEIVSLADHERMKPATAA